MAVYLGGFLLSCIIIAAIEGRPHHYVGYWFWLFAALLIPCLIAGLRADTVGTDVLEYVEPLYGLATKHEGLIEYFDSRWLRGGWSNEGPADFEVGFSLLVWAATRLTGSLGGVLFAIQAFTVVPVFAALAHQKTVLSREGRWFRVWLGMAVYYLLFYCGSLNLMRQWIAMAILLCALSYLDQKGRLWYLCMVVLAMLFHRTAVIGVAVLAVRMFTDGGRRFGLYRVEVVAIAALALWALTPILGAVLTQMGLGRYGAYFGNVRFSPLQFVLRVPALAILGACWKCGRSHGSLMTFFMACAVLDMMLAQAGGSTAQGARIAYYFGEYLILSLPWVLTTIRDASNRVAFVGATMLYLLVYWVFVYAVLGTMDAVPYQSVLG